MTGVFFQAAVNPAGMPVAGMSAMLRLRLSLPQVFFPEHHMLTLPVPALTFTVLGAHDPTHALRVCGIIIRLTRYGAAFCRLKRGKATTAWNRIPGHKTASPTAEPTNCRVGRNLLRANGQDVFLMLEANRPAPWYDGHLPYPRHGIDRDKTQARHARRQVSGSRNAQSQTTSKGRSVPD